MHASSSCPVIQPRYYGHQNTSDVAPFQYATNAIPRYAGYIPGKYSETVYAGIPQRVNKVCQQERTLNITTQKVRGQSVPAPPPERQRPWDRRGHASPFAGDYKESMVASPRRPEATAGAKSAVVGNIPGYGGHIPGHHAENVYGNTWQRTLDNSNRAHEKTYCGDNRVERDDPFPLRSRKEPRGFWDQAQNKNRRSLITKEGTVIPRVDSDHFREIAPFNPAYNDLARGYSGCPFTGKNIDPAGRNAPVTRQEGHKLAPPPTGVRANGYMGFIPGKYSENVIGERERKTNEISSILTSKTRIRTLQT